MKEVNPRREGKKLLVLDIDYTLFDHRYATKAETLYAFKHPSTLYRATKCSGILIHQNCTQICGWSRLGTHAALSPWVSGGGICQLRYLHLVRFPTTQSKQPQASFIGDFGMSECQHLCSQCWYHDLINIWENHGYTPNESQICLGMGSYFCLSERPS